ncbi:MAG: murein biosynthesis integral membrane protein MurJ [Planctomycetaceae bacterium]|nr:murein biosynthesis integral membrane protein MurJ [Planctomycetaceae bacterium]
MDAAPTPDRGKETPSTSLLANLRIVSLGTLLSRILGLLRDIGMASLFGAGTTLDAFIVAFRVPNLTRQLFGEGALTTAFLPVFLEDREKHGEHAARATLTAVAVALSAILLAVVLVAELVAVATYATVTLSPSNELLLLLFMILLPYLLLICLAALCCASLHAMREFLWPALVPVVLNVVWLVGLTVAWLFAEGELRRVTWIAFAIPIAGVFQLALPVWVLFRRRHGFVRDWRLAWPRVGQVFRTMLPVVGGIAILQVNTVVDSLLAWGLARPESGGPAWIEAWGLPALLESGTASALYIGQRMYQFPLGVFGIALGTVLYPVLTRHAQRGEFEQLRKDLSRGIRIVIAIGIPASLGLVCLAKPITTALFQRGQFTAADGQLAATMVAIYGAGVWVFIGLAILNRAFYATGDRLTPMRFGIFALAVNLLANAILVVAIGGTGLAWGSVIASSCQLLLTIRRIDRQLGSLLWKEIFVTAVKTVFCTAAMTLACVFTVTYFSEPPTSLLSRVWMLVVPMGVSVVTYLATAKLFLLREPFEILSERH